MLVAGAVGVTPLLSMAAALRAKGRPFRAVYSARSSSQFAFANTLESLAEPGGLTLHCDEEAGRVLDIAALLEGAGPVEEVYVCGPRPMIEAAVAASERLGWPKGRLRFELFSAAPAAMGDMPFEVELKSSGKVLVVEPEKTILEVLLDAGEDPLHDCRRGDCSICQCGVLGELLHRTLLYSRLINAPTAVVGHDDLEMYERAQEGLMSSGLQWVNQQRLWDPAESADETVETNGTTERQMRNQFRAWAKMRTSSRLSVPP